MSNFNKRLIEEGGSVVCSSSCTLLEVAEAKACKRFYVDEHGFGFVYFPPQQAYTRKELIQAMTEYNTEVLTHPENFFSQAETPAPEVAAVLQVDYMIELIELKKVIVQP